MAELRDNGFRLFTNTYKTEGSNQPDYTGKGMVDGVEKAFAGWVARDDDGNTKKDKNGNPMVDFKISEPYDTTKATASPEPATVDDDLPFQEELSKMFEDVSYAECFSMDASSSLLYPMFIIYEYY